MWKSVLSCLFLLSGAVVGQTPTRVSAPAITGVVERYAAFPSKFVDPRNVDVWLPADYSPKKRYAVVYMHDGQMLFDAASTWNKQEWRIDETMTRLANEGKIRDAIVVGVWKTPQRRSEYMPAKAMALANEAQRAAAAKFDIREATSDAYLRFLEEELKPFIDRAYRVRKDRANTFVMGSSMGGLISLYALAEYPRVFGGAACVSTHFPAGDGVVVEYLRKYLGPPHKRRLYFDYGTATLDATYEPYQLKADAAMRALGWTEGRDWTTRKFDGADHSETSWAARADIPLIFLLGKRR